MVCCPSAVVELGEWRPRKHAGYPPAVRAAVRTMHMLARARRDANNNNAREQSCLSLLPEEVIQYLYTFITAAPVCSMWSAMAEV